MFTSSRTSPFTKWNRLWKDKCWNRFTYGCCINQNKLIDMETLRNIDVPLMSSLLTLKRFQNFSKYFIVDFGEVLPAAAEIKVKTSKNYKICKLRYKLSHINQTGQSMTWKETRIGLKKYAKCWFWANIYEIYRDFRSVRIITLSEKKRSVKHLSGPQW